MTKSEAEQINLPSCKFIFHDGYTAVYHGYSLCTSTGDGWDNVAVTFDELSRIATDFWDDTTIARLLDLEPSPNGLYSLAWQFKTRIVK